MSPQVARNQQDKIEPGGDSGILADARVVFAGLWLVSFALQVYASPDWLSGSVRVIAPPVDCVLSEAEGWNSPLSLLADGVCAEWAFLLFAPVAAAFLAAASLHLASFTAGWLVAAFLVGSSLSVEPQHLLPAVLIFAMFAVSRSKLDAKRPEVALRVLVGCSIVAVLVTIEFGFVALIAASYLPGVVAAISDRRRALLELGGVVLLGLLALAASGSLTDFGSTFLRPVSWLWIPTQAVGLTSTEFALSGESFTLARGLLAVFLFAVCASLFSRGVLLRPGGDGPPLAPLLVAGLIGLACGRFFWLGACSIAAFNHRSSPCEAPRWSLQFLSASFLIVAFAEGAALLDEESAWQIRPARSTELVDPAAWEVSGNVLLMDLDQSADWHTEKMRAKYRLLIDDRWDVFGDRYLEYAAVCRDVFEIRPKSYLRADGAAGGYLSRLKDWSPIFLVTDCRRVERVRQLSLSPHWTVLGADGRRVILGWLDDPQIGPQRQRAAGTLLTLEWPVRPLDMIDSVLVAGDDEDLRRVAAVLCAMRLPCAALRTLPEGDAWSTLKVRTWCCLELAHRARRHSGEIALLDQFRALALVRKIHAVGRWDSAERIRIARSLNGLGQRELAGELAPEFEAESARGPALKSSSEFRLRQAMASGEQTLAQERLAELSIEMRKAWSVLVSAPTKNADELTTELLRIFDDEKSSADNEPVVPDRSRSELFFVLGCVALEAGQTGVSAAAFSESARLDPQSPLKALRVMHLQRLASR